jgi:hypothetical protein
MWRPAALALGAVLAAGGLAPAGDTVRLGGSGSTKGGTGGATLNLAGSGTVAEAATADDVEATWYHRGGFYGGYRGGYGYYRGGYRGFYGGGFYRPYYGGFYRPYFGYRPFYRPYYGIGYGGYYPYYGGSVYVGVGYGGFGGGYYGGFGGYGGYGGFGGYCGIGGKEADASAPVISLDLPAREAAPAAEPITPADSQKPATAAVDLPVVLKNQPPKAYTFKAYGEK